MSLVYSVVSRGQTVLAEWSESVGNFGTITRLLLAKMVNESNKQSSPTSSGANKPTMISYIYDGKYVFHCLTQANAPALRFIVMAEKSAGVKMPYRFLLEIANEFLASYGTEFPLKAVALAYAESFSPAIKALQVKYNDYIARGIEDVQATLPDFKRIREQVDAIQDVMVDNIDEILARTEKIDLLVDKAELINTNTFAFRRQAQHYQRMMWWRQKKLYVTVFAFILSAFTLLTSIEFGFPIPFPR